MALGVPLDLRGELRISAKPVLVTLFAVCGLMAVAEQLPWTSAPATDWVLVVLALSVAAWGLENWKPLAGRWCTLIALGLAIYLLTLWLAVPEALTLLAIPVAVAAALIGLSASASVAVAETLLVGSIATRTHSGIEMITILLTLIAVWAAFGVMAATYRPVSRLASWSWVQFRRAQQLLDEARNRQGELRQALNDLAHLNQQLALANQKLDQMRWVAEEATRAKADFVAKVSHELRTPLNMIIGFGEMITEAPEMYGSGVAPALLADLEVILRNSQHLSSLIDDVLDLSQIDAGQMALRREHAALDEIVQAAVIAVRPLFDSKGLFLKCRIEPGLPSVYCDRTRVREVILNLLSNAGRFTDVGGVELDVQRDGENIIVSVTDTGPGIGPEGIRQLFRPFQQLEDHLRRRHSGSGLGLAISKSFVELHGGRMSVESEIGQGTTFSFRLPIAPTAPIAENALRWLEPTWEYRERSSRPRLPQGEVSRRLVVLEEGRALQCLLTRYLDNVQPVPVRTIDEAIAELEQAPAQALLVNAPSVPDSLQRITTRTDLPHDTPAIICSIPELAATEGLDVSEYLLKPVSRERMLDALKPLCPPGGKILIVDDEPDALRLFWRMLAAAELEYQVLTASDGKQALALALEVRPDVILLDLVMPAMDGFQFLAERSGNPALRDIPVIAVSALDPAGHPIISNALAVTRPSGISAQQFLMSIEGLAKLLGGPSRPGTSSS